MSGQQASKTSKAYITVNDIQYSEKDIEALDIDDARKKTIVKYLKTDTSVAQQMLQMALDNNKLINDNADKDKTIQDQQHKLAEKDKSTLPFFQKEVQWKNSEGKYIKGTGIVNSFIDDPLMEKKELLKLHDAGTWSLNGIKVMLQILYQRDLLSVEYKTKLDGLVNNK